MAALRWNHTDDEFNLWSSVGATYADLRVNSIQIEGDEVTEAKIQSWDAAAGVNLFSSGSVLLSNQSPPYQQYIQNTSNKPIMVIASVFSNGGDYFDDLARWEIGLAIVPSSGSISGVPPGDLNLTNMPNWVVAKSMSTAGEINLPPVNSCNIIVPPGWWYYVDFRNSPGNANALLYLYKIE